MSNLFDLACGDCKEFIYLGDWSLVEDAGNSLDRACWFGELPGESPYPTIRADSYLKVLISADDIEAALRGEASDQSYIRELIPIVGAFAREHRGHELFLTCVWGGAPWSSMSDWGAQFLEWKTIPGPND
jgi:hypothetical protein